MRVQICFLLWLAACLPLGCQPSLAGSGPKPASSGGDAKPEGKFDFNEYLRREIGPLPNSKVSVDVLEADVEAAAPPTVLREKGSLKLVIPIGTKSTVDCFIYDERTDGASTVWSVVAAVKKSLELRLFEPTDVFEARGHAALMSRAIYFLKKDGVGMAGELKLAYYEHPLVSTLCMHDEAGYEAAFKRITKGLFESVTRSDRELRMTPVGWEIAVLKVNGHPVGYENRTTYETKTETIVNESVTAKLLPRSRLGPRTATRSKRSIAPASCSSTARSRAISRGSSCK